MTVNKGKDLIFKERNVDYEIQIVGECVGFQIMEDFV